MKIVKKYYSICSQTTQIVKIYHGPVLSVTKDILLTLVFPSLTGDLCKTPKTPHKLMLGGVFVTPPSLFIKVS